MRSTLTNHYDNLDPALLGGTSVYEPLHLNDMSQVGHDRIQDLYSVAAEVRAARRVDGERLGLVTRTRWSLGRRLISIGSAVSGQHA